MDLDNPPPPTPTPTPAMAAVRRACVLKDRNFVRVRYVCECPLGL